jgi:TatD DNase family protein
MKLSVSTIWCRSQGIVTFKNGAAVQQVAAEIPLWKFMVETDCPFLGAVLFAENACEPAHTRIVAEAIAVGTRRFTERNC